MWCGIEPSAWWCVLRSCEDWQKPAALAVQLLVSRERQRPKRARLCEASGKGVHVAPVLALFSLALLVDCGLLHGVKRHRHKLLFAMARGV